jgi:hypothetical protein
MKLCRGPVVLFLLAASVPFVVSITYFVISQRHSLLRDPEAFIASLKQTRDAFRIIPLAPWKFLLARDPLCREAETVLIGSSREAEIDATIVGTSVCNLYVDGLSAPGFTHLGQVLSPLALGQHRVVYIGIDHFWLWYDADPFKTVELQTLAVSKTLWKVWSVLHVLDFFTMSDLHEAMRRKYEDRGRFEDQAYVWYADGHMFHPYYYTQKRAGIHHSVSQQDIEDGVNVLFGKARVYESNRRALERGIRLLYAKGYTVRMFWNPVSSAHIAAARHYFPVLFQQTMDAIDRLAVTLPLDRYFSASQTLDASQFGCTEGDDLDAVHVDIDCLRRVFGPSGLSMSEAKRG